MSFKKDWLPILLLFVFAGLLRSIPEIKMGAWPIGYDTFNTYAPDLLKFDGNFLRWLFSSNFIYFLLWPIYKFYSIDPYLLVKIFGSVLYGLFAVSVYAYVRKALNWSIFWSVLVGLLLVIQLPALRMSWDLFRNILALILLMPAVYLLDNRDKWYHGIFLLLFSLLIIMSNQLVACLWYILVFVFIIRDLKRRNWLNISQLLVAIIPSLFVFYVTLHTGVFNSFSGHVFYRGEADRIFNYFEVYTNTSSYSDLANLITSYFYLNFKYILPLVLIGFWYLRKNLVLTTLTAFLLFGTFSSIILNGYGLFVWSRWLYMLVIPFTIYAIEALKQLSGWVLARPKFQQRSLIIISKIIGVTLMLIYFGFIFNSNYPFLTAPQDKAKKEFSNIKFTGLMPSTMIWNAIGYKNEKDVLLMIAYANKHLEKNSVLLVDNRYRGLILVNYDYSQRYVVTYTSSPTLDKTVVNEFKDTKLGPIYTIRSIHDKDNNFDLVVRVGNDGIFREKETSAYFKSL